MMWLYQLSQKYLTIARIGLQAPTLVVSGHAVVAEELATTFKRVVHKLKVD